MKVSPEMKKLLLERGTVGPAPQLPGQPPAKKGPPGQPKYRNKPTKVDGITFQSRKEAKRWVELKHLLAAGRISILRRQVSFRLEVRGVLIARYIADFVYVEDGRLVVNDTKGFITPVFKLKRKLMKACHNIEILET